MIKWLGKKQFTSNKGVFTETEAYFTEFNKSYFLEGLKKLRVGFRYTGDILKQDLQNVLYLFCINLLTNIIYKKHIHTYIQAMETRKPLMIYQ